MPNEEKSGLPFNMFCNSCGVQLAPHEQLWCGRCRGNDAGGGGGRRYVGNGAGANGFGANAFDMGGMLGRWDIIDGPDFLGAYARLAGYQGPEGMPAMGQQNESRQERTEDLNRGEHPASPLVGNRRARGRSADQQRGQAQASGQPRRIDPPQPGERETVTTSATTTFTMPSPMSEQACNDTLSNDLERFGRTAEQRDRSPLEVATTFRASFEAL